MIFDINVANYRLYFNLSGGDRVVTLAVSGAANVEVKAQNGSMVMRQVVANHGGVMSLRIPAQHFVEVDAPAAGVKVEIQDTE
jgi:hypothetical protein